MALPLVTQSEMISDLAERTDMSRQDIKAVLDSLADFIQEVVGDGERVKVAGVVIEPAVSKARKKRMGRNPQTGEEVQIKAKPASVRLKAKVVLPLKGTKLPSVKKLEGMM